MAPISSRWHAGDVPLRPYDSPSKQAALIFALYGLRRQLAGDTPGKPEATITITGPDGQSYGHLDLDVDDIERVHKAIGDLLDRDFGPFDKDEVQRLLTEYPTS